MPTCGMLVPEPDQNKDEKENPIEGIERVLPGVVQGYNSSSEEDINVEESENDGYSGYEQLPMDDNLAQKSSEEEEEDTNQPQQPPTAEVTQIPDKPLTREFEVNEDLIRNTMKNIKLSPSFEPTWVKDLSDDAWNNFIKNRIHKSPDKLKSSATTSKKTSSNGRDKEGAV